MHADTLGFQWVLGRDEAQQLSSFTDIFIIAASLRQLLMGISCDDSLSEMITVKFPQTMAVASEEMFK